MGKLKAKANSPAWRGHVDYEDAVQLIHLKAAAKADQRDKEYKDFLPQNSFFEAAKTRITCYTRGPISRVFFFFLTEIEPFKTCVQRITWVLIVKLYLQFLVYSSYIHITFDSLLHRSSSISFHHTYVSITLLTASGIITRPRHLDLFSLIFSSCTNPSRFISYRYAHSPFPVYRPTTFQIARQCCCSINFDVSVSLLFTSKIPGRF